MSIKKDKFGFCFCGQFSFEKCCGCFIIGGQVLVMVELLMCLCYMVFVLCDEVYLCVIWFLDILLEEELISEIDVKWIGLDIKKYQYVSGSDEVIVEFVVCFKVGGKVYCLYEISNFVCQFDDSGQVCWYYVDGCFLED